VNPSAQYLPPFGEVLIGSDDPQPFDRFSAWNDALELWLESRCSPNTQRAYAKAWQLFQESAGKHPWLVGKSDVLRWQEQMRQAGLTKETIHLSTPSPAPATPPTAPMAASSPSPITTRSPASPARASLLTTNPSI
jgi:hypothetical protein